MKPNLKKLLFCLAVPLLVGVLAGLLIRNSLPLYQSAAKPPLSPPAFLFPIVWTLLYLLMGFGSYLIIRSDSAEKSKALTIYVIQLLLNFLWPLVFFNYQAFLPALIILSLLWYFVLQMLLAFRDIAPLAGYLQIPYLLWLTFAFYLNLGAYLLNR